MAFQITLSEHRVQDGPRTLLRGTTDIDVPTMLFEYNGVLLSAAGAVDATKFPWIDDAGEELVREIAGLSWHPIDETAPVGELLFRIEEDESHFMIETRPAADPRPLLIRYLAGGPAQGAAAAEVLDTLFLYGSVRQASRYAAACGWGMHSNTVRDAANELAGTENPEAWITSPAD